MTQFAYKSLINFFPRAQLVEAHHRKNINFYPKRAPAAAFISLYAYTKSLFL